MAYDEVILSVHAIRRMFEQDISEPDVREVLERGDIIEEFTLDMHAIKRLHLAYCESRPVHVVIIDDDELLTSEIDTVYEPDLDRWHPGFRRRRTP